jgi:hypothetical protein
MIFRILKENLLLYLCFYSVFENHPFFVPPRYPQERRNGYSFILNQSEYREILQDQGFDCDPYSFMVWGLFIQVNKWINQNQPDEKISLFFESGYKTQKRANELLQVVTQDSWRGNKNRVASYSFVCKEDSEPTQAADLVAWHVRKGFENRRRGKPIRKDTQALFKNRKILTVEFTCERLKSLRDDFLQKSGTLENAARTIFSFDGRAFR